MDIKQYKGLGANNWIPLNTEKVVYLVVHHIASSFATPEDIDHWHFNGNGWRGGIGYNEYIRKDGTIHICRGDHIGAHTRNFNSKSYGIAVEGNYQKEYDMPVAQRKSLIERLRYHKNRFASVVGIKGHGDLQANSCPGRFLDLDNIIEEVYDDKTQIEKDVELLTRNNIIKSPNYWLLNLEEPSSRVRSEFVKILIQNMAKKIRKEI